MKRRVNYGLMLAACAALMVAVTAQAREPESVHATSISDGRTRLETRWRFTGSGSAGSPLRLELEYVFHNTGDGVLALIDRGNTDRPGTVKPRLQPGGEGLVMSLIARPIPDPEPTHPEVPLARQVLPGTAADGSFSVRVPATMAGKDAAGRPVRDPVTKLRFCLGYAPFSSDGFVKRGDDWIPSVATVERLQRGLCTAWFDLSGRRFERDAS